MPVKGVIDDINWLPIQNVYQTTYLMSQYKVRYNKIIEVIMKLYFSILDIHFKNINIDNITNFNFEIIFKQIKNDVDLGNYNIPENYEKKYISNKVIKKSYESIISEHYLYQIWLYYNHVVRYNNDVNITDKEREEYSKTNNIDMNNNEISVKKKIEKFQINYLIHK